MDAFGDIQKIISANLNVPVATVHPNSKSSDFAEWDSVNHLVLVMEIEEKFQFKFPLTEIAQLDSVDKIVSAVEKRAKA